MSSCFCCYNYLNVHCVCLSKSFFLGQNFTEPSLLDSLTEAASHQHAALHNLPQGTAEEYYICACQKLEGYGQELLSVKDSNYEDVNIGVSLLGITVSYLSGKEGHNYRYRTTFFIISTHLHILPLVFFLLYQLNSYLYNNALRVWLDKLNWCQ